MGLLRCIVIKASQVFQSGSVAKLVLILENKTNEKERCQFSFKAPSLLKYTAFAVLIGCPSKHILESFHLFCLFFKTLREYELLCEEVVAV